MSRHEPEHGADSAAGRSLLTFTVTLSCYDGGTCEVRVYAMGRHDAEAQARRKAQGLGYDPEAVIAVEQVADPATEYADAQVAS